MVVLVVSEGNGSMDLYSQELAARLDVPKLRTDIYQKNCELFNIPLFSKRALQVVFEDLKFVRDLNRLGCPIHFPNHHFGRYGLFLKVPFIITVHDLIRYFDLKGMDTLIHRPNLRDKIYLSLDYLGIKRARRIIAVSHTTKRDLVKYLGIPEEKIKVIYEGIDLKTFRPVRERVLPFPYILYVGSEHPRKNLKALLEAFALLKRRDGFEDLKLVKVGAAGGNERDFRSDTKAIIKELGLESEVFFTERVPVEKLVRFYSNALCLVLPSLYEGFGFPALEAMACGCPVIVSNRGSLPEIAGDAALVVNPQDPEEIARAILKIAEDEELRRELSERGLRRASLFTWDQAAAETAKVYREVEREVRALGLGQRSRLQAELRGTPEIG